MPTLNRDCYSCNFPCGKTITFKGERTRDYHVKLHIKLCLFCANTKGVLSNKEEIVHTTIDNQSGTIKKQKTTLFNFK